MSRRLATQRGAAFVEMAFVIPVYFMLCWGFIEFSLIMFGYCNATYASKLAARYAAIHGSTSSYPCVASDLSTLVSKYLWGAPANGVTINSTWNATTDPGNWVNVNVSITYPTGIPLAKFKSVTIGTTATELITQ